MTLPEDLSRFLCALNAEKVEFLVVGAYAVGVYAEPRATGDLDLFFRPSPQNGMAARRAIAKYGVELAAIPRDFAEDRELIVRIGEPPAQIDIVTAIDGVEFEDAWRDRVEFVANGINASMISAEHLIRNKLARGGLQNLADLEAIRAAEEAGRQNSDPV